MGVLVGTTQRVRIGTAVLVMPYRNPVLLARMLATLDVLSGGWTMLGAGVGWLAEEFAALEARPFAACGRVTDECIEIVKRICQGGDVRRDLFHRLNVYSIHLPPLRERKEDIIPLAMHFLSRSRQALQKEVVGLT